MDPRQQRKPIYEALRRMAQRSPARFHVPGHKGGTFFPQEALHIFAPLLQLDLTELPGLDDLHDPRGIIAQAQELAAEVFHADRTYFLVGGSTVGNLAMILGTIDRGDQVFVARHSHRSVFHALSMAEAEAIILEPEICPRFQVPLGVSESCFEQALRHYPQAKAIILTYPNYYGQALDIEPIIRLAHERNMLVLVDEAHGAHFGQDECLPRSAMQLGADVSVQSTHKMLASMTMTSMLHIKGERVSRPDIEACLHRLQSSSPSYPLLASLDLARAALARMKPEDWHQALDAYRHLRERLHEAGWTVSAAGTAGGVSEQDTSSMAPVGGPEKLRPKTGTVCHDPFKLIIRAPEGWHGFQLQQKLFEENIAVELADPTQILLTLPLAPQISWHDRLLQALDKIRHGRNGALEVDARKPLPRPVESAPGDKCSDACSDQASHVTMAKDGPRWRVLQMKRISLEDVEEIDLSEAAGRLSAEMLVPYPPGVPLLIPGEEVDKQCVARIRLLQDQGAYFQGKRVGRWTKLKVFKSRAESS